MIADKDTNLVYISDRLKVSKKDVYNRFISLLDKMEIDWKELPGTNDIWARDYMPIQLGINDFLLYNYNPDYLQDDKWRVTITDALKVCNKLEIPCHNIEDNIKLDGGNITLCGDYIVMTNKVFTENGKEENDPEFIKLLQKALGEKEIIVIPWHCLDPNDEDADRYGHSDGFIHWCGGNKVLMSNHRDFDANEAAEIKNILESYGFDVTEILFNVAKPIFDYNWAYINYLQVGNKIIVPAFGIEEDEQALNYIKEANQGCEIRQFRMRDIANYNGALHCITWNIKR